MYVASNNCKLVHGCLVCTERALKWQQLCMVPVMSHPPNQCCKYITLVDIHLSKAIHSFSHMQLECSECLRAENSAI